MRHPATTTHTPPHLTRRECQVLDLLAQGQAPTAIRTALDIAPSTYNTYILTLRRKLGLPHMWAVVVYACYRAIYGIAR